LAAGAGGLSKNVLGGRAGRFGSIPRRSTQLFSIECMNSKQMKKWLEQQGATFQAGKGSHLKVFLNGRQSTLPMHGTAELGKGIEAAIKRQLGLK
jgi:mRNA interferase HicA